MTLFQEIISLLGAIRPVSALLIVSGRKKKTRSK